MYTVMTTRKMYIKILRFLTDGSASETIELIMRTGMSTAKLQQMSPAFVNKKMRLMAKKNNKNPSGNPPCDDELIGILLLPSSCSQKVLCSVSFPSGGGGSSFFKVEHPWTQSIPFLDIANREWCSHCWVRDAIFHSTERCCRQSGPLD